MYSFILTNLAAEADVAWKSKEENVFVYINNRPMSISIDKMVQKCIQKIKSASQDAFEKYSCAAKYPLIVLFITLPNECVDMNVEPEKNAVVCAVECDVYKCVDLLCLEAYPIHEMELFKDISNSIEIASPKTLYPSSILLSPISDYLEHVGDESLPVGDKPLFTNRPLLSRSNPTNRLSNPRTNSSAIQARLSLAYNGRKPLPMALATVDSDSRNLPFSRPIGMDHGPDSSQLQPCKSIDAMINNEVLKEGIRSNLTPCKPPMHAKSPQEPHSQMRVKGAKQTSLIQRKITDFQKRTKLASNIYREFVFGREISAFKTAGTAKSKLNPYEKVGRIKMIGKVSNSRNCHLTLVLLNSKSLVALLSTYIYKFIQVGVI